MTGGLKEEGGGKRGEREEGERLYEGRLMGRRKRREGRREGARGRGQIYERVG